MTIETIFQMSSPYRDDFRIKAFRFGEGRHSLAIVGTMRGDEVQQQYVCAQLVNKLKKIEAAGEIAPDRSILIIPSCNPFSMNVQQRFWAMDNTDINRMFPGYDKGETTQRIAAAVFNAISNYEYGIQLASFYMPGDFVPHVRMLKTGYEAVSEARLFGLPYVTVREPLPFDTGLLNYNWQVWECKAFSLYAGHTRYVDHATSKQAIDAILRFMHKTSIISRAPRSSTAYDSIIIDEKELTNIKAKHAGILMHEKKVGDVVYQGDVIGRTIDPYDGSIREEIKSPTDGVLFFATDTPTVLQNAVLYRIQG